MWSIGWGESFVQRTTVGGRTSAEGMIVRGRRLTALAVGAVTLVTIGLSGHPSQAAAVGTSERAAKTVALAALPPVAQPGKKAGKPATKGVLSARFKPAKAGGSVSIERRKGSRWVKAGTTRQQRGGYVVAPVKPGTYRLVSGTTTTATAVMPKWRTQFQETFSGRRLDPRKWRDQQIPYGLAGLRACSTPSPKVRKVQRGSLVMGVAYDKQMKRKCRYRVKSRTASTRHLLNTQVVTQDLYEFKYGHVAARVKFSRSRGRHSGIWIATSHTNRTPGALPTEIDIAEFFGDSPRKTDGIASFIHEHQVDRTTKKFGKLFKNTGKLLPKGQNWWNSFHVVSVEWTPTDYIFRIDGKEYWRMKGKPLQSNGYLVLSALTSDYEIKFLTKKTIKETTSVDWIRVWAL